jgi:transcriptional regulator of aromatic amino acid metabolism
VDLKPLMPTMKECVLSVGDNGKAVLQADNGTTKVTRELTNAEFCRLSQVLGDTNLSNDAKKMRIAGMVKLVSITGKLFSPLLMPTLGNGSPLASTICFLLPCLSV